MTIRSMRRRHGDIEVRHVSRLHRSDKLLLTGSEYESALKIAKFTKALILRKRIAEKLYDRFGEQWEFWYLVVLHSSHE